MKGGLILVNAYSTLKASLNQSQKIKQELNKLGVEAEIKNNDYFASYINGSGNVESCAKEYDFCVYLDKDKYISAMLEKAGLRLFNSHTAICDCDDKMLTAIRLANSGIPMPKTMAGFLCYDKDAEISLRAVQDIEEGLGYPLVVKSCYGSLGKGVYLVKDRTELFDIMRSLKCEPHLFQQFISTSKGRDIRAIVIGGKFFTCMQRISSADFRSNIELGGRGYVYNAPQELIEMCERTAKILGLDYCGIDLLFGENGYILCEVNSNAFFGGIERVTGKNVAQAYAQYIVKQIYG